MSVWVDRPQRHEEEELKIACDWRTSILIQIFENGDKKKPENYRGNNLLITTLKLFTRILTRKLNGLLSLLDEQQGFRTGTSSVNAIFVIRQICEKALDYNKSAYMCFVDLANVSDRIQLHDVIQVLNRRQMPATIIDIIKESYTHKNMRFKCNAHFSQRIAVGRGIRQGDSFSPLLFNLVMDEPIIAIKSMRGYRICNANFNFICYADDGGAHS